MKFKSAKKSYFERVEAYVSNNVFMSLGYKKTLMGKRVWCLYKYIVIAGTLKKYGYAYLITLPK